MDFSHSTFNDMLFRLNRNINPFTGYKFSDNEAKQVTDMMTIIHAAVNNYEVNFNQCCATIPILDLDISITEETTIKPFTEQISNVILTALKRDSPYFSQKNIQRVFHNFLKSINLIELKIGADNKNHYYATQKGELCGLENETITKKNGNIVYKLLFSAYMQAYLVRVFPEIFIMEIKEEFYQTHINVNDEIKIAEPLTVDERNLVTKYQALNDENQKLLENYLETLYSENY